MSKKLKTSFMTAAVVLFGSISIVASVAKAEEKTKPASQVENAQTLQAEGEKAKALQNPYPNDLGPAQIDGIAKGYPKDIQDGYELVKRACAQCHQASRPLNSRFVEPEGEKGKKEAAVEALKKSHPELFEEPAVWQIESNVWERYVKRMMSKPGCKIEKEEGKKIWKFLVYDSSKRKLGDNAKKWEEHRKKLIEEFKTKYPKRYEELEKEKDL